MFHIFNKYPSQSRLRLLTNKLDIMKMISTGFHCSKEFFWKSVRIEVPHCISNISAISSAQTLENVSDSLRKKYHRTENAKEGMMNFHTFADTISESPLSLIFVQRIRMHNNCQPLSGCNFVNTNCALVLSATQTQVYIAIFAYILESRNSIYKIIQRNRFPIHRIRTHLFGNVFFVNRWIAI